MNAWIVGLICPKDVSSSISLGSILSVSDLPVAAYSPLAAAAMQVDIHVVIYKKYNRKCRTRY